MFLRGNKQRCVYIGTRQCEICVFPKFLIDFPKEHKTFVYEPQAIQKIPLALK